MLRSLTPIILIIGSILLFFLVIQGQYTNAQQLADTKNQLEQSLANFNTLVTTESTLSEQLKALDPLGLNRVTKSLPGNTDTIRSLLDLQNMGARYGIAIKNIQVGDSSDAGQRALGPSDAPVAKADLSFSMTTSYANLQNFLHDIEKSLRIIEVKSINLTTGPVPGQYAVNLTVETYWLKNSGVTINNN